MDQATASVRETIRGTEVDVLRGGNGPALLLLHGGSGPQIAAPFCGMLQQHFDLIAPTHPGYATCPLPDHFDSIHDLAYLYLDLLEEWDLRDVTVMGFSMGGWLAMEMAIRNTDRIARMILVNSVGIKVGGREDRDIADLFAMSGPESARVMFHDPSNMPDPASMDEAALAISLRNRQALAMYGWEPYLHNPKLKRRLYRVDVPTKVLWGVSDDLVPLAYGQALAASIPGATFTQIEEAGHSPQTEQPEAFVGHVTEFAARPE